MFFIVFFFSFKYVFWEENNSYIQEAKFGKFERHQ